MKNATTVSVFLLFILIVSLYGFRFFIQGPQVKIADYESSTTKGYIDLSLQVSNTQQVTISGNEVTPLLDGSLLYRQYLQPGANTVVIQARDRYDSFIEKQVQVFYRNQ